MELSEIQTLLQLTQGSRHLLRTSGTSSPHTPNLEADLRLVALWHSGGSHPQAQSTSVRKEQDQAAKSAG